MDGFDDARQPDEQPGQSEEGWRLASEFLDQYHHRASVVENGQVMFDGGQILENITQAMERIDLDINTEISIEEDVASVTELSSMTKLGMGSLLMCHVVNTAMQIMLARYPEDLVRTPIPTDYDLRKIIAIDVKDDEHDLAKKILARRLGMTKDLDSTDIDDDLAGVSWQDQLQVFVALFYMFGNRLGAIKYTTGIE
jgi:hypothetical protein